MSRQQNKPVTASEQRPHLRGKLIYRGNESFFVKGVSYGAFRPDEKKREYRDTVKIDEDFAMMAENGINTVRIPHTMPPVKLLDIAASHGLLVMVGLSGEHYVGHLMDRNGGGPDVPALVREKVSEVAGHPALLCYGLGNEVPAPMARWLGRRRLEQYIETLYHAVKEIDPEGIVTYVNYPTTEYLELPFLDVLSYNVYLEDRDSYRAYLARLQNHAGVRPLLMTEVGLDAIRNGEERQAEMLDWLVRDSFRGGCAGAVVFAWTDEWYRGEHAVGDWAFGITDEERRPKPALSALKRAFEEAPFGGKLEWPGVSVVVCTHNGSATIRDTLKHLEKLDYPDYEVLVVNDGSTDDTAAIVAEFPSARHLPIDHAGLSAARNEGLKAATREIIAYIDDDAYPDRMWLRYIAEGFRSGENAAVGGLNVCPPEDGMIARCVANSPGGPVAVLLDDDLAEHIPGCNMAFRREILDSIGGFDPVFHAAGDDVDVCWRVMESGGRIGYYPAALVWHHCRSSIRAYWRQQAGYGKAEALLEAKWPERYNSAGHHTFEGRIYSRRGQSITPFFTSRVYHGIWGGAPFQSLYEIAPSTAFSLLLMPEWYLLLGAFAFFGILGIFYSPLLWSFTLMLAGLLMSVFWAWKSATISVPRGNRIRPLALILTTLLHLLQPLARLVGRVRHGLIFWRHRCPPGFQIPWPRQEALWTETWIDPNVRMRRLYEQLKSRRAVVICGDAYADWDLEVRGGAFGSARALLAVEDHAGGAQYVRLRSRPLLRPFGRTFIVTCLAFALAFGVLQAWIPATVFLVVGIAVSGRAIQQVGRAQSMISTSIREILNDEA